jgi:hypothetical protein
MDLHLGCILCICADQHGCTSLYIILVLIKHDLLLHYITIIIFCVALDGQHLTVAVCHTFLKRVLGSYARLLH